MQHLKGLPTAAALLAAAAGLASASDLRAELTYDLRAADGGKAVQIDHVGQVVRLELYAIVQSHDGIDNETFYDGWIRLLSNDAGAFSTMRGDFSPFSHSSLFARGPVQRGLPTDIDRDGDLDLGALVGNSTFIFVRGFDPSGRDPVGTRIWFHGNPDAEEFLLGTVELAVRSLGGAMTLSAERATTWMAPAALFVQDGHATSLCPWDVPVQGADSAAAPVLVTLAPEPLLLPMLLLLPALRMHHLSAENER